MTIRGRLRESVRGVLASHSDAPVVNAVRGAVHWALELLHSENHDFRTNGEARVLACLGSDCRTIVDVGANRGVWALQAHRLCPDAGVYCFEIASETRRHLRANVAAEKGIHVLDYGLSNRAGGVNLKYYANRDVVSSMYDYPHPQGHVWSEERVQTGDMFVAEHGIAHIDLLKIDTEGADFSVLRGFDATLSKGSVRAIQFEYGFACVLARSLLIDFYEYLESKNYLIGKVHSKRVDFRPYRLQDENFFGPNFLAVHRDLEGLIARLASG